MCRRAALRSQVSGLRPRGVVNGSTAPAGACDRTGPHGLGLRCAAPGPAWQVAASSSSWGPTCVRPTSGWARAGRRTAAPPGAWWPVPTPTDLLLDPTGPVAERLQQVVTVTSDEQALAFEQWVRPHLAAMWALASRLAGPVDRDDVYQEALSLAWSRWHTYDSARGAPKNWLLVLVAERSRRAARWKRRDQPLAEPPAPEADRDLHLDLGRAVQALPRRQRLAVDLYYTLDLSVADTAAVMGCSVGTVSSTVSDARAHLRRLLGGRP